MSAGELMRLAKRVEQLSGPDREVDLLILAEIEGRDIRWDGNMLLGKSRRAPYDECRLGSIDPGTIQRNFSVAWMQPEPPAYTASLDAAITLVPKGYWLTIKTGTQKSASDFEWPVVKIGLNAVDGPAIWKGQAKSLPITITAASLRARALASSHEGSGE